LMTTIGLLKEDVTDKDQLALIPITNKSILEFYPPAEIPAGTYSWQPRPISTAAVKAVLVSFDFRRKDCDNVGRFAQLVSRGLDSLQKNGHSKWKAVDFNNPLRVGSSTTASGSISARRLPGDRHHAARRAESGLRRDQGSPRPVADRPGDRRTGAAGTSTRCALRRPRGEAA